MHSNAVVAFSGLSVSIALFYSWEIKQLCPTGAWMVLSGPM